MIKFESTTISTKNSKASSLPYCGIYGIYTRGNVLIGTIQEGKSITFRKIHQGHNTWSVTTISIFDEDYKAIFSKEEALLWNLEVKTKCCVGKRNGEETPLIIVNNMMQQEDFFLRPLLVSIRDGIAASSDWWETCERLNWWKGNMPNFDWANEFNAKDIEHCLSNEINIPKDGVISEYINQKDIPDGYEVIKKEGLSKTYLTIKEKAPEIKVLGHINLDKEGELRPRRGAKVARKSSSEDDGAPVTE